MKKLCCTGRQFTPIIAVLLTLSFPTFIAATPVLPGDVAAGITIGDGTLSYVVKPGDVTHISCLAMVRGCVRKPFYVKIEIDGKTITEQQIESPDPGCTIAEERPYPQYTWDKGIITEWTAVVGTYTIRCTVDSKSDITEVNENNNTDIKSLTVRFPALDKIKDIKTKAPIPVPVPGPR
jgi:hypothetical protein